MKKQLTFATAILFIIAFAATPVTAFQTGWGPITVHIVGIQTGAAPLDFDFTTDNTPSTCSGAIFYIATGPDEATKIANANAAFAGLLAAQLSGHSVSITGLNPTSSFPYCQLQYLWTNNQ